MELFGETLSVATALFLLLALLMAFGFEFINGFHDTANALQCLIAQCCLLKPPFPSRALGRLRFSRSEITQHHLRKMVI
jgi:hypothetical protein